MSIEVGSEWVDDKSGLGVVVESIIAAASEETRVVYKLFDNIGNYLGYNSCTYEAFLDSKTPKECSYEYDQNINYRMGFNDGWHDCEASFELGNEFTDSIQEQAYDEGYVQAIDDLIESGVIGESDEDYSDEEYSEYKFGAVEDDEEEYCFSKELDKVKEGGCVFILDGKVVGDRIKDSNSLDEYNRGYEDGKSRGITLGYNKRDYEESRVGGIDGSERKHSHYFKDVRHLDYVDIYQVCKLFEVEDSSHCTQHSIKKLLMSGKRGAKDKIKDITEARDTLSRYLQIEGYE